MWNRLRKVGTASNVDVISSKASPRAYLYGYALYRRTMYEKELFRVYWDYGIHSFPVDCKKILNRMGFKLLTYQEISGNDKQFLIRMMQVSGDAFIIREEKRLYYNEKTLPKRLLFSLAHEIGHIVTGDNSEDVANDFASNLLAPRPIIYAKGLRTAEAIAKYFGISISAANNALIKTDYRPDADGIRIIDFFSRYYICDRYEDLVRIPQSEIIHTIPVFNLKPIDKKSAEQNKKEIRSLDRKRTRLYEKMVSIDALSSDAEKKYKELQRQIWDIEKQIERLENRIPEIIRITV